MSGAVPLSQCIRGAGRAAACAPAARGGSKERAERGEGSRESIADGTALRDIVGEEVAATFGALHHYDEGLFVYVAMLPTLLPIGVPGNFNSWGERERPCNYR